MRENKLVSLHVLCVLSSLDLNRSQRYKFLLTQTTRVDLLSSFFFFLPLGHALAMPFYFVATRGVVHERGETSTQRVQICGYLRLVRGFNSVGRGLLGRFMGIQCSLATAASLL